MARAHAGTGRALPIRTSVRQTAVPGLSTAGWVVARGFFAPADARRIAAPLWCARRAASLPGVGRVGDHQRGRLRRVFPDYLGFSPGMPAARAGLDYARERRRQ